MTTHHEDDDQRRQQLHPIGAAWWHVDRAQLVTTARGWRIHHPHAPDPDAPDTPPTPAAPAAPHAPRNVNERHREALASAGFNTRVAVWLTKNVGTMQCAYLFAAIGIGSLVGIVTGNALLAGVCGSVSSYFLQLFLLPVLAVGQAVMSQHQEIQADEQYHATLRAVRDGEQVRAMLADVLARLPVSSSIPAVAIPAASAAATPTHPRPPRSARARPTAAIAAIAAGKVTKDGGAAREARAR